MMIVVERIFAQKKKFEFFFITYILNELPFSWNSLKIRLKQIQHDDYVTDKWPEITNIVDYKTF